MAAPDDNLAMLGMMNPAYLFSHDQLTNQFSPYNNQPLSFPPQYVGMPTDSMGRPIGPPPAAQAPAPTPATPPGTTLNSSPGNRPGWYNMWGSYMGDPGGAQVPTNPQGNYMGAGAGGFPSWVPGAGGRQSAPAASGGGGLSYSDVLSRLANPGAQQTYGSTARPAPSIMPSMVAAMTPRTGAGGNYSNAPLVNTLKGYFNA